MSAGSGLPDESSLGVPARLHGGNAWWRLAKACRLTALAHTAVRKTTDANILAGDDVRRILFLTARTHGPQAGQSKANQHSHEVPFARPQDQAVEEDEEQSEQEDELLEEEDEEDEDNDYEAEYFDNGENDDFDDLGGGGGGGDDGALGITSSTRVLSRALADSCAPLDSLAQRVASWTSPLLWSSCCISTASASASQLGGGHPRLGPERLESVRGLCSERASLVWSV